MLKDKSFSILFIILQREGLLLEKLLLKILRNCWKWVFLLSSSSFFYQKNQLVFLYSIKYKLKGLSYSEGTHLYFWQISEDWSLGKAFKNSKSRKPYMPRNCSRRFHRAGHSHGRSVYILILPCPNNSYRRRLEDNTYFQTYVWS